MSRASGPTSKAHRCSTPNCEASRARRPGSARTYVLACGGIENARPLLLSNEIEPAGLGNRNDLVGRFFMEHPHNTIGVLTSDRADHLKELYGRRQFAGGTFEL